MTTLIDVSTLTEDGRARLAAASRAARPTNRQCRAIAALVRQWRGGVPMSPAARAKLAEASRGMKPTALQRQNLARLGR